MRRSVTFQVDPAGGQDFRTLGEAIAAAEAVDGSVTVLLAPGVYREKVMINRPDCRLVGLGTHAADVELVWDDHALRLLPDGRPMRTFLSATLFVGGDRFEAENLTVRNDAGPGTAVGQALAAYVDADRAVFRRCRLLGHQDTLFTGPLPPFPLQGTDFGGPRDTGPDPRLPKAAGSPAVGHQLYEDCLIEGDVDFIFGSAEVLFRRCEIRSLNQDKPVNGWISAASTPEPGSQRIAPDPFLTPEERGWLEQAGRVLGRSLAVHGYLFVECRLTSEPGVAPGSVYLGRPWRDWARTLFLRCHLGNHIHPAGWDDWAKPEAHQRSLYAEVECTGPGAGCRTDRAGWTTHIERFS